MHTCRLLLIDLHFCLCRSILCHVTWEYSKLLSCIWSNLKRELYTMMQLFLVFSWAKLIKSKIGIICQWHVPQTVSSFTGSRWNRNLEVLGFVNGGYTENPEKNLRIRWEPTTTQPAYIYDAMSGIQTQATLRLMKEKLLTPLPHTCSPIIKLQYFNPYTSIIIKFKIWILILWHVVFRLFWLPLITLFHCLMQLSTTLKFPYNSHFEEFWNLIAVTRTHLNWKLQM